MNAKFYRDALAYFNKKALDDQNFAMNFALFFSSRTLDSIVLNGSKIRAEMLNVLQQNFMSKFANQPIYANITSLFMCRLCFSDANQLKSNSSLQFYNSITLLGEYYHRARIADKPVRVLGQSLLQLLTEQLQLETERMAKEPEHIIDTQFSKLILSQVNLGYFKYILETCALPYCHLHRGLAQEIQENTFFCWQISNIFLINSVCDAYICAIFRGAICLLCANDRNLF